MDRGNGDEGKLRIPWQTDRQTHRQKAVIFIDVELLKPCTRKMIILDKVVYVFLPLKQTIKCHVQYMYVWCYIHCTSSALHIPFQQFLLKSNFNIAFNFLESLSYFQKNRGIVMRKQTETVSFQAIS